METGTGRISGLISGWANLVFGVCVDERVMWVLCRTGQLGEVGPITKKRGMCDDGNRLFCLVVVSRCSDGITEEE
ncbi:hypothetical protein GOBAR_DD22950 [Gossypium barbadense]|nr:hypothetical protein GOBAR_DD22950 [Gossypium barbadense]